MAESSAGSGSGPSDLSRRPTVMRSVVVDSSPYAQAPRGSATMDGNEQRGLRKGLIHTVLQLCNASGAGEAAWKAVDRE